jgi:hypothetical protein
MTNTAAVPVSSGGVAPKPSTSVGLVPAAITSASGTPTIPANAGAGKTGTSVGVGASATSSGVVLFTGAAVRVEHAGGVGAGVAAMAGLVAFLV